ncbi:unnamed protein product [Hapterophycus canaliculatus]
MSLRRGRGKFFLFLRSGACQSFWGDGAIVLRASARSYLLMAEPELPRVDAGQKIVAAQQTFDFSMRLPPNFFLACQAQVSLLGRRRCHGRDPTAVCLIFVSPRPCRRLEGL